MLALARGAVRLPFGVLMLDGGLTVREFADRVMIIGQMSDDGILAVAPRGLRYEGPAYDMASDLNGVTVTAVARTEQELLHLRSLTINSLHFPLIAQE